MWGCVLISRRQFIQYPSFSMFASGRKREGKMGCWGISLRDFQMRSWCRNRSAYQIIFYGITCWLHTWLVQLRLHWQATLKDHRPAVMHRQHRNPGSLLVTFGPHNTNTSSLSDTKIDTEHHIICVTPHFLSFDIKSGRYAVSQAVSSSHGVAPVIRILNGLNTCQW